MNKKSIAGIMVAVLVGTVGISALASAKNNRWDKEGRDDEKITKIKDNDDNSRALMVRIGENGMVQVHGAQVTAISGTTLTAVTKWGSVTLVWTVQTDQNTIIRAKNSGILPFMDIRVGDTINFTGPLVTANASLTVQARELRNHTTNKDRTTIKGLVGSVTAASTSFTVVTQNRGTVTVTVGSSTQIKKGSMVGVFTDITANTQVEVRGMLNTATNVLAADEVRIIPPKPEAQTFQGTLKAIAGTVVPTTLTVTINGVDYTVQVGTSTSILTNVWLRTSLTNFKVGDTIRIYGTMNGTTIDATVVRDTSIIFP